MLEQWGVRAEEIVSQHMTIMNVACHLGVRWAVVKAIQKESVHRRLDKPRRKGL